MKYRPGIKKILKNGKKRDFEMGLRDSVLRARKAGKNKLLKKGLTIRFNVLLWTHQTAGR